MSSWTAQTRQRHPAYIHAQDAVVGEQGHVQLVPQLGHLAVGQVQLLLQLGLQLALVLEALCGLVQDGLEALHLGVRKLLGQGHLLQGGGEGVHLTLHLEPLHLFVVQGGVELHLQRPQLGDGRLMLGDLGFQTLAPALGLVQVAMELGGEEDGVMRMRRESGEKVRSTPSVQAASS